MKNYIYGFDIGGSGKQVAREDTKCVTTFAHVVCACYIVQAGNCTLQRRGSSATIATPNNIRKQVRVCCKM
jgi:hypothetical protein